MYPSQEEIQSLSDHLKSVSNDIVTSVSYYFFDIIFFKLSLSVNIDWTKFSMSPDNMSDCYDRLKNDYEKEILDYLRSLGKSIPEESSVRFIISNRPS